MGHFKSNNRLRIQIMMDFSRSDCDQASQHLKKQVLDSVEKKLRLPQTFDRSKTKIVLQ